MAEDIRQGTYRITPALPGNLDLTKRLGLEAAYSDEAMDARAQKLSASARQWRENGGGSIAEADQFAELQEDARAVGWWLAAKLEPRELASVMDRRPGPLTIREKLQQLGQAEWLAKLAVVGPVIGDRHEEPPVQNS